MANGCLALFIDVLVFELTHILNSHRIQGSCCQLIKHNLNMYAIHEGQNDLQNRHTLDKLWFRMKVTII